MKKYINRSSMIFYVFIILLFLLDLVLVVTSYNQIYIPVLALEMESALSIFYTNQMILFLINGISLIYLVRVCYIDVLNPTSLSFLLSGKDSKDDIKKYLFKKSFILYILLMLPAVSISYGRFNLLLRQYPSAIHDSYKIGMLLLIMFLSVITMYYFYKTDRCLIVSNQMDTYWTMLLVFSSSIPILLVKLFETKAPYIIFVLSLIVLLASLIRSLHEIKTNKTYDIC